VLQCEANDRIDPGRERCDVHHDERLRRGMNPPERGEEDEDRVDVRGQAVDLLARGAVRHVERTTLCRAPDRLNHVPEVEAVGEESLVALDRECCNGGCPYAGPERHDGQPCCAQRLGARDRPYERSVIHVRPDRLVPRRLRFPAILRDRGRAADSDRRHCSSME